MRKNKKSEKTNKDVLSPLIAPEEDVKTKRVSKYPMIIGGGIALFVLLILIYAINKSSQEIQQGSAEIPDFVPSDVAAEKIIKEIGNGVLPVVGGEALIKSVKQEPLEKTNIPSPPRGYSSGSRSSSYSQDQEKMEQRFSAMLQAAINGNTSVDVDIQSISSGNGNSQQGSSRGSSAGSSDIMDRINTAREAAMKKVEALGGGMGSFGSQGDQAQGNQQNFQGQREFYSYEKRVAPRSAYEIKTGTILPAIMDHGINSDLPGQLTAHISQNVYDTATGGQLLIPQGTRAIGTYDSTVLFGQSRLLVAWNRLVFPDGSTFDIGQMPGTDQMGLAGFKDKTNHHYLRIFGSAILMSAFSGGIQLSQPQTDQTSSNDAQQTLSAALGQQLGQVAIEMVRKNMNIEPTIEIRAGLRFTISIVKDLDFGAAYSHYETY